jgi:hypothetical protein
MGTGAKIAIGCGCILLLGAAAVVGVVGMGAFWAKGKITEATGGLEKIAAKTEEIEGWEEKANANAYTPPADGIIPEARFLKFLDTRKRVFAVYERYEADLRELQKKSETADKLAVRPLSAGGLAEVFGAIRLEQMKALAELGMSETEYRDIQIAVYKSAWASDAQTESGKLPAEAVSESMSEAAKQMQDAMRASLEAAQKEGVPGSGKVSDEGRATAPGADDEARRGRGPGAGGAEGQRRALPEVRGRHQEVRHARPGVRRLVVSPLYPQGVKAAESGIGAAIPSARTPRLRLRSLSRSAETKRCFYEPMRPAEDPAAFAGEDKTPC